ncbi:MAG: FAD-binding protein [Candidatus Marinimicrobia bacterium]|nr:FAD-binding protein [Candidatus Neomarinimicrobiota bacterium]
MKAFDIVIVGAGMAGMRAAIGAVRRDLRVAVISKVHPLRSPGLSAEEGLNAVLHEGREEAVPALMDLHIKDARDCGYQFSDDAPLETMVRCAPGVIRELERWGCPFSLEKDGRYALRRMGAVSRPRNLHVSDKTGHAILYTLYEQCVRLRQNKPDKLRFFEEWLVLKLLVSGNAAAGVIAMQMDSGKTEIFHAKSIIWASGGSGRVYGSTSNALTSTGLGLAVPVSAGVTLQDMEFVQFGPTQLPGSHIQITEAALAEGALLLNRKGERFLASYNDSREEMELSPQDVICRNIYREILAGRGIDASCVHLDMRTLGRRKIRAILPVTRELCRKHAGADPASQLIPVRPGQNYMIGGIHTDEKAGSDINGLFAAGECANPGVHGANACEGDPLTGALVFAEIAADSASKYAVQHRNRKHGS